MPNPSSLADLAALAVHEAFHVYQQGHSEATWQFNELDALTYPAAHSEVLICRAMEMQALQRALTAPTETVPQVAAEVLYWRKAQEAQLAPEHLQYIRRAEKLEGWPITWNSALKPPNRSFPAPIFQPRRCGCAPIAQGRLTACSLTGCWQAGQKDGTGKKG
ncbi:hypothetical protein ACFFLM_24935 [Deinococcus oregonensis]|uniref:DUF4157 domain-containing protein n=1 Tax=Deinococcus oregonensis TaxID=1805970 RepID=A0ABV6B9V1_9DEIO